ncbi:MAG: hypothetical protein HY785_12965 [Oscillatoriophycideae cyanobacterium NC_groundwater_1537_Pr4_S-0.65um_50_18]|nr:hypothetical protein [Oscillatoriophycideae cyanobacterium NC_groundwater_1537_Pr4_S-0.65um_50_18]
MSQRLRHPFSRQTEAQKKAQKSTQRRFRRSLTIALPLLLSAGALIDAGAGWAQSEPGTSSTADSSARFTCELSNGEYTVMYRPQSQPSQSYAWAQPGELGGGWTPERRCAEIGRRLEFYRPDGLLEMRTAIENGYNTICVTTEQVSSCRIVLTVPPGQDPIATRDRVFSNLTVADSGEQTNAVNTFSGENGGGLINRIGQAIGVDLSSLSGRRRGADSGNSSDAINLRPFLDTADGGTGSRLR